jgi:hypothetical protein
LDGNGVPDEIGINPDNQQPGYPGGLPDGNANSIPSEYGDGPDLDGNGVPDEIGINPDILQPGYPGGHEGADIDPLPPVEPPTGEALPVDETLPELHIAPPEGEALPVDETLPELHIAPPEGEVPPVVDETLPPTEAPTGDGAAVPESAPALDPNLLDPIAPGPTLDYGLVERIEQSPELVNLLNQDPAAAEALERDPTQIDQIKQDLDGAGHQMPMEPSGDSAGSSFADPSLTELPTPEPSTPDDGADDVIL